MPGSPEKNESSSGFNREAFEEEEVVRLTRTCRHFSGLPLIGLNPPTCRAGIDYETVKDASARPFKWACLSPDCTMVCDKRVFYTREEAEARRREVNESVRRYLGKINDDICPVCDGKVTRQNQVGPCVYAEPCGHRLFQGEAREVVNG